MKRLLVPTDFSEEAEDALKIAAQIAKRHGSDIYLLHLLEMPLYETDAVTTTPDVPEFMFFMKMARERFQDLVESDYLAGITVHEVVKADGTFNNMSEISQEHQADMIVMGSHGASGFQEMFIGSNAEKVVRTSDIPVLVIKSEDPNFEVKNMVFASDFKNDNKETYKQAAQIADKFGAQLHLLMVNTPSKFSTTSKAKERIANFTEDYTYHNQTITIYNDESVEKGILNFSKEIDADLIGISTHGRQGIAHFFNGSISEDLVNHAKRPVMTFKI
ncbi:MAG: universal stress protein [Bacteroidota bacterium]